MSRTPFAVPNRCVLLALTLLSVGCSPDSERMGTRSSDASMAVDASTETDGATSGGDADVSMDAGVETDSGSTTDAGVRLDSAVPPPVDAGAPDTSTPPPTTRDLSHIVVVTANVGTSGNTGGGFTSALADASDTYYGNGLSWLPAVDAMTAFFAEVDPDVVVFQEVFDSAECAGVPGDARRDFVCDGWHSGDPTVAQLVLTGDWQVMYHPGNSDKCAAVNRRLGSFHGCDSDYCVEGLDGYRVPDCGGGARVARGTIDLVAGGTLTLVNFHGTSGRSGSDKDCRVAQVEQVFIDLGDGEPGANGANNLIMGDFNTDPGRAAFLDSSARRWNDFVDGSPFHYLSEVGFSAPGSYAGVADIDHVVSDVLGGSYWIAGFGGHAAVMNGYFDHAPVVCDVGVGR